MAVRPAAAQSIGLEAGIASVEGYEPVSPSLGVALHLPLTARLRAGLAYMQWTGCDRSDGGCQEPRTGYGNRGVHLSALLRVAGGARGPSAALAAGAAWYEMLRVEEGSSQVHYQPALTLGGELRLPVAFNSATYLRGELGMPSGPSRPRWGHLRLGVDVRVF